MPSTGVGGTTTTCRECGHPNRAGFVMNEGVGVATWRSNRGQVFSRMKQGGRKSVLRVAAQKRRPQMSRRCFHCRTAFEPANDRQRYCGQICRRAAYRAANRDKIVKYRVAYYAANREEILKRHAAYRAANRDRISRREATYRAANRDRISKYLVAYRAANRNRILKQSAAYYAANRDKVAKRMAAYYRANRDKIAKRSAAYRAAMCGQPQSQRKPSVVNR